MSVMGHEGGKRLLELGTGRERRDACGGNTGDGAVVVWKCESDVLVVMRASGAEDEHIVLADAHSDERRVREREGEQFGRA